MKIIFEKLTKHVQDKQNNYRGIQIKTLKINSLNV